MMINPEYLRTLSALDNGTKVYFILLCILLLVVLFLLLIENKNNDKEK